MQPASLKGRLAFWFYFKKCVTVVFPISTLRVFRYELQLGRLCQSEGCVKNGEIWINPGTGKQLERWPWLRQEPDQRKFTCDIYHDRPDDCKHYPVTIDQMIEDECEMSDTQDLDKPKQAQKGLDHIMRDSRPTVKDR